MTDKVYEKRKQAIQALPDDTQFFWQSYGYIGNCLNLHRLGGQGYTTSLREAQLYSKEETLAQLALRCDTDVFWDSVELTDKSKLMVDHQDLDNSKRY